MLSKKLIASAGAIAALGLGSAAIADAASSSPATTTTTAANPPGAQSRPAFPAPGTTAHEDAEKAVTGAAAAKAQAAAVKSVGSGTAGAVTTGFNGRGYEVTVTKSDGSKVEVHLDSSFNVARGPAGGCPGGPGGRMGPPQAGSGAGGRSGSGSGSGSGSAPSGTPPTGGGAPPAGYGSPPASSTTTTT